MAKKKKQKAKSNKKQGMGWRLRLLSVGVLLASLAIMPTTVLFVIAMVPTFVALYVDKDKNKKSAYSIGVLNIVPTIAFIIILWEKGHYMANTVDILTNPLNVMIIYGIAWMGWVIHFIVPPIVADFVKKNAQKRVVNIHAEQSEMVDAWGEAVRGKRNEEDEDEEEDED